MDTGSLTDGFDFESFPPHPLIYASLVPWHSCKGLLRLDLHKPKTTYTIGRAPTSDFTFQSRMMCWAFGSITWDGEHEIRLTLDESAVSSVWVNCKQLKPGQSRLLQEDDQIRIGYVEYDWLSKTFSSQDLVYVFHQYTSNYPAGLLPEHLETRKRLDELERERTRLLRSLPSISAVPRYDFLQEYNDMRQLYQDPGSWPDDPRLDQPDCDERIKSRLGTVGRDPPPPIQSQADLNNLYFAYEGEAPDGPDWNDPDLVWRGDLYLNRSRPLTIPVSMIHWSNVHRLPVYLHPGFDPSSTVTTAYAYAAFSDNFSDESAARDRAHLGHPALEHAPPLRPRDLVQSYPTSDALPALLQEYLRKKAETLNTHTRDATLTCDATPTRPSSPAEPALTRSPSTASLVKRRRLEEGREDSLRESDAGGESPKRRKASLPPVHTRTSPSFTDSSKPASATLPVCTSPRDSEHPGEENAGDAATEDISG